MSGTPSSDYMIGKYESESGDQILLYNSHEAFEEPRISIVLACPHKDDEKGYSMTRIHVPSDLLDKILDDLAEERGETCTCGDHDDDEDEED